MASAPALLGGFADWQVVLFVVGAPGLLLALLIATTVSEPLRRGQRVAPGKISLVPLWRELRTNRVALLAVMLGTIMNVMIVNAQLAWFPTLFVRVHEWEPARIALALSVVGVPFDMGTTYRPGARFGPRAVREQSVFVGQYPWGHWPWEFNIWDEARVVDWGDAPNTVMWQGYPDRMVEEVRESVAAIHGAGVSVLALGGDHMVAYPLLAAAAEHQADARPAVGRQGHRQRCAGRHQGLPLRLRPRDGRRPAGEPCRERRRASRAADPAAGDHASSGVATTLPAIRPAMRASS